MKFITSGWILSEKPVRIGKSWKVPSVKHISETARVGLLVGIAHIIRKLVQGLCDVIFKVLI